MYLAWGGDSLNWFVATGLGDVRVQRVTRKGRRTAYTIVGTDGRLDVMADRFLRQCSGGTDRTYAYLLVDHLRWLDVSGLSTGSVCLADLRRYMGSVGAEVSGVHGVVWRPDRKPYGPASLKTAAACLKSFYVFQATQGVNQSLADELDRTRLPTTADRRRMFLGHVSKELQANPLAPSRPYRRHPKLPPEGARAALLEVLTSARDRMVVTWLADSGVRVGALCGLHLVDLHLREGAACGECRAAHLHVVHRDLNPNQARAKVKKPWDQRAGVVSGGVIHYVSPAMIHTYFDYMTTEYPPTIRHGMLLVRQHGRSVGEPLSTDAVRSMLERAGVRAGLGKVLPHSFRHQFATSVLDASGGNSVIARDAGGWASASTVEQIYGHADLRDPSFRSALATVWGEPS